MVESLFAILLSFQAPFFLPGRNPETPEEYRGRMRVIARSIVDESDTELWRDRSRADLVSMVTVTFYEESHLFLSVHKGRKRGARGRANCLGQIVASPLVPRSKWRRLHGSDLESTRRCTAATIELLSHHTDKCVGPKRNLTTRDVAKVFAGYAKGHSCQPGSRSSHRARQWAKVRRLLGDTAP